MEVNEQRRIAPDSRESLPVAALGYGSPAERRNVNSTRPTVGRPLSYSLVLLVRLARHLSPKDKPADVEYDTQVEAGMSSIFAGILMYLIAQVCACLPLHLRSSAMTVLLDVIVVGLLESHSLVPFAALQFPYRASAAVWSKIRTCALIGRPRLPNRNQRRAAAY